MVGSSAVSVASWRRLVSMAAVAALAVAASVVAAAQPARAVTWDVASAEEFAAAVLAAQSAVDDAPHTITITADFTWTGAIAEYNGAGAFHLDGGGHTVTLGAASEGLIYIQSDGKVRVEDLTIAGAGEDSDAIRALDVFSRLASLDEPTVELELVNVRNVHSEANAVELQGDVIQVQECIFEGNVAEVEGPGVLGARASFGDIYVNESQFLNNESVNGDGGAIYAAGYLDVTFSTFAGNYAYYEGGAIYGENGDLWLEASTLTDNLARGDGGAVSAPFVGAVASLFDGNESRNFGGAIRSVEPVHVAASAYVHNQADLGGAIMVGEINQVGDGEDDLLGSLVTSSTFHENSAEGAGGAIFSSRVNLLAANVTFTGNAAPNAGSHLLLDDATLWTFGSVYAEVDNGDADGCSVENIESWGYNYDEDESCTDGLSDETDWNDVAGPLLGELTDNQGLTPTRHPLPGSTLIDRIPAEVCEEAIDESDFNYEFDQRYVYRGVVLATGDEGCDVGAVEVLEDVVMEFEDGEGNVIATGTLHNMYAGPCFDTVPIAGLGTPPAGVSFTLPAFRFCAGVPSGWDKPWTGSVTWQFSQPVNSLWKVSDEGEWSSIPGLVASGGSFTYSITDGGALDGDPGTFGVIYDPLAAGVTAVFAG